MRYRRRAGGRPGTTMVESAVVYAALFFIIFGLFVAGTGVFRYQECAHLAREGARWASTHGHQYRSDAGLGTGSPGGTYQSMDTSPSPGVMWYKVDSNSTSSTWTGAIYNNAIQPGFIALDSNNVTCLIGWPPVTLPDGTVDKINGSASPDNWPGSKVFVKVSYQWFPEIWLVGPFTLTSTAAMPITN